MISYTLKCLKCGDIIESSEINENCPSCGWTTNFIRRAGIAENGNKEWEDKCRDGENGSAIWWQRCEWDENGNLKWVKEWDEAGIKNGFQDADCIVKGPEAHQRATEDIDRMVQESKNRREQEQRAKAERAAQEEAQREQEAPANVRKEVEKRGHDTYTRECSECGYVHVIDSDSALARCPLCGGVMFLIGMTIFSGKQKIGDHKFRKDADFLRTIWQQTTEWDENGNLKRVREWDEDGVKNGAMDSDCIEKGPEAYQRAEEDINRRVQESMDRREQEQRAKDERARREQEERTRRENEQNQYEQKMQRKAKAEIKRSRIKKITVVGICFFASLLFFYLLSLLPLLDNIDRIQEIIKIKDLLPEWYYRILVFIGNTLPEFFALVTMISSPMIITIMLISVALAIGSKGSMGVKIVKIIGFPIAGGIAGLIAGPILVIIRAIIRGTIGDKSGTVEMIIFMVLSSIVVVITDLVAIVRAQAALEEALGQRQKTIRNWLVGMLIVAVGGVVGYIFVPTKLTTGVIAAEVSVTVTVIPDNLNFRSGPSPDTSVLKVLKKGDNLTVTGDIAGGWVPVEYNGEQGYVSAELVSIDEGYDNDVED